MSFLLEVGRRRRGARPLFDHRPRAGPDLAHESAARPKSTATPRSKPNAFAPCSEPPLQALRALIAESRIALPDSLPPMAAGVFGYLGYDMVRLMEELPPPNPDPIGIPDAILVRPTIIVVFDAVKDLITVVTPVRPEKGVDAKTALARAVERLVGVVDALDRPLDKSLPKPTPARSTSPAQSNTTPRRIQGHGAQGQGLHRRRRCLPGRAGAALRGAVHAAAVFALSRAAADQSVALSVLPRFRRLRGRRIEPGNSGESRRATSSPFARSPAHGRAARRRTKTRRSKKNCWPIRRSAPSISCCSISAATTSAASPQIGTVKVTDQFFIERYSHVMHIVSNVEGKLAEQSRCARCAGRRVSRRHRLRRAEGARDADHRRTGERKARALCRLRRLFFRRRRDGHLHRAAHRADQGRHHVCAGRRRHRRRQRSGLRAAGMHQQGDRESVSSREARRRDQNEPRQRRHIGEGTAAKLRIDVGGFYGDYWILEVGEHYEYAVVGVPSRDYLWILGPRPTLEKPVLDGIVSHTRPRSSTPPASRPRPGALARLPDAAPRSLCTGSRGAPRRRPRRGVRGLPGRPANQSRPRPPPSCAVCHASASAPVGAVDQPFGESLVARGLASGDLASLTSALNRLRKDGVDSDGDGAQISTSAWGGNPNHAESPAEWLPGACLLRLFAAERASRRTSRLARPEPPFRPRDAKARAATPARAGSSAAGGRRKGPSRFIPAGIRGAVSQGAGRRSRGAAAPLP